MYIKTSFKGFRKLIKVTLVGVFWLTACTPTATGTTIFETGEPAQIPATAIPTELPPTSRPIEPTALPTENSPANTETEVTFGVLSLVVPPEVASGVTSRNVPRLDSEEAAWWQKTPGHLEAMLGDYYVLQGNLHLAKIFVYPAQAYAELVPPVFESIHRLNNILGNAGRSITAEQLPGVPFLNARQIFAANIKPITFQNGSGVRFLTEYAQYNAPANNHEIFYHFQGVTQDGAYYVVAIFPITAPMLAETNDPAAALPPGGITYPYIDDPNADWDGYYGAVTSLLNATTPDAFTPMLNHLDLLIQSIKIAQ
jgi:hypothetical protein